MLDINFIRENPDKIKQNNKIRKCRVDMDELLKLDTERRKLIVAMETNRAEVNKKSKNKPDLDEIKKLKKLGEDIKKEEHRLQEKEEQLKKLLNQLPNLTHESVPVGVDESGNKVIRKWGEAPIFDFKPKEHWELGEELGVIDTKRAGEIAGSRFAYLKGNLARMQFAIIQYTLDRITDEKIIKEIVKKAKLKISTKPFTPVVPPVFIKPEVMQRMARLEPREERYYIASDDQYLVGSAEHTLGPLHMDETLNHSDLPIRYIGYSTAFRREAGSYGKDTKGILRVHQFDKLEIETFSVPGESLIEQDFIVAVQEYLLQGLKLPYQVVAICAGDMGGPDYRQIDIETWLPGQNRYRETNTSDYMTDYQARRLNTKVRLADGKVVFAHMNDATAFAIGRTLIAIMENYQQKDDSIKIPEVLQPYLDGQKVIKK